MWGGGVEVGSFCKMGFWVGAVHVDVDVDNTLGSFCKMTG